MAYNDAAFDAYPSGSTGLEENALVLPVDLRGPDRTIVQGTLVTEAIDPTSVAFWKEHKPDLNDSNIVFDPTTPIVDTTINGGSGHPDGISILDSSGEFVSLSGDEAFPNKLLSGQPASWMTDPEDDSEIEAVEVTIRATLKYTKNFPTSTPTAMAQNDKHVVETRIRLTQAPAGSTTYTTTGSYSSGDPVPTHLAYFIWCSVNNVAVNYVAGVATPPEDAPAITDPENFQWEGEHQIIEDTLYSIITPANTLNLSGGNADWESMNAVIYAVDIDFFQGATNIQFGPFKHLQAAEYFEMVMAFRHRQVWDNPQLRNNGQGGTAGATDLGNSSPKENTTHGLPQQSLHTVISPPDDSGNVVILQHDAKTKGGQFVIQTLDSSGTVVDSAPQVQLAQNDLGTEDDEGEIGRIAKWRLMAICDSSGAAMQAMFAMSEPEDLS